MVKVSELKARDVINIRDGRRLGEIKDIELDMENGKVQAMVLPGMGGGGRFFSLWMREEDVIIPWSKVKKIGMDVILVEVNSFTEPNSYDEG